MIQIGTSSASRILDVQGKYKVNNIDIFEIFYPIGSIYMSDRNENPKDLFGFGEWSRIKDKFILAGGPAYSPGSTGGRADSVIPSHTHTYPARTLSSAGAHTHTTSFRTGRTNGNHTAEKSSSNSQKGKSATATSGGPSSDHTHSVPAVTSGDYGTATTDVSITRGNLPPYIAVYMWERIG